MCKNNLIGSLLISKCHEETCYPLIKFHWNDTKLSKFTGQPSVNTVACVLTKVGKWNQCSGKHIGASRDFRKKTHFKQYKDQIATNRRSEGTHFVSSETQEHLFSILILGWRVVCIYTYFILVVNQPVVYLLPL